MNLRFTDSDTQKILSYPCRYGMANGNHSIRSSCIHVAWKSASNCTPSVVVNDP